MSPQAKATKYGLTEVIGTGLFWMGIQNIVNKVAAIITSLLKIRYLSVFHYGLLSLTISGVYLIDGFVNFGIVQTVIADLNIARGENKKAEYKALLVGFTKFSLIAALILWLLVYIGLQFFPSYFDSALFPYIKLFSFIILITPFYSFITIVFQTHLKFKHLAIRSVLQTYVNFVLIVFFTFGFGLTVERVLYAELLYHLVSVMVFLPLALKEVAYLRNVQRLKKNVFLYTVKAHGKWAIFTNYFSTATQRLRTWLIALFLNVEAVAIFNVAHSIYKHLVSVIPIQTVLAQIFPQQIKERAKVGDIFRRSVRYSLVVYIVLAVVGIATVPFFVTLLFPQYTASIPLFYIFMIIVPQLAVSNMLEPLFNALRLQRLLFFLVVSKNVVMFALLFVLAPPFGTIGVAIEFIVSSYIFTSLRYWYLRTKMYELTVSIKDFFTIDEVDKIILKKVAGKLRSKLPV